MPYTGNPERDRTVTMDLALPVGLLYVVVHARGQAIAAFQAAALEYTAAPTARHALPETVYAHSAASFWLISSLWHIKSFLLIPELFLVDSRWIIPYGIRLVKSDFLCCGQQ